MKSLALLLGLICTMFSSHVYATATPGVDWQINFFDAVTPVMQKIHDFHTWTLMPIITVITIFVLILLIYVCVRFRKARNPSPSKTTHHVGLEIVWTLVPVIILIAIAIPSMRLIIMQDETPKSDITIKAIGYQWYWGYEYPEAKVAEFSSYMRCPLEAGKYNQKCLETLKSENIPHKLAVDYPVVVPVDKTVRLLITAMDVMHSFAIPSFGVKRDAVPGRMNQSWFKAEKIGTYYGQCSELCGVNHAFMPITFEVVPQNIYDKWLDFAQVGDLDAGNKVINDFKSGKEITADNFEQNSDNNIKVNIINSYVGTNNNDINMQTTEKDAQ